ncbi:hypothetical protein AAVH_43542, partial [Aphelenchoides avenae]
KKFKDVRESVLWKYAWPANNLRFKLSVVGMIAALALDRVVSMALPLFSKWIVDDLAKKASSYHWMLVAAACLEGKYI